MFHKNKKGQSTAEYAIVASAILLAVAAAAQTMGSRMQESLTDLGDRAGSKVDELIPTATTTP